MGTNQSVPVESYITLRNEAEIPLTWSIQNLGIVFTSGEIGSGKTIVVGGLGQWWYTVRFTPVRPPSTYKDQENDIQETAFNNMFKPFDTSNQGAPNSTAVVKHIIAMDWSKFPKDGDAEQYYYTRLMYAGHEMQVDIGTMNASTSSINGIFAGSMLKVTAGGGFTPSNQRRRLDVTSDVGGDYPRPA